MLPRLATTLHDFGLSFNKENYNMHHTLFQNVARILHESDRFAIEGRNTDHWSLVYVPRSNSFKLKGTLYDAQWKKELYI